MTMAVVRGVAPPAHRVRTLDDIIRGWVPRTLLGQGIQRALPYLPDPLAMELAELIRQAVVAESSLAIRHLRRAEAGNPDAPIVVDDYGVVSRKVVTDTGVGYIVDAFQNTVELENMKFHGVGTGTNAEAAGNTALQTESTTILNPDSTRATGSTTEGASANIYRTVGTVSFDGSGAITEHGIFSQAATGGGVLLDRSQFSAINVGNGDSIQATYDLTFTSGG